jgi:hypothetical protein
MTKPKIREALRVYYHFRRGYIGAHAMCKKIVFFCVNPATVADVLNALPEDIQGEIRAFVQTLPTTTRGWSRYRGVLQLDGDEHTMAALRAECRAAAEAVRGYFLPRLGQQVSRPAFRLKCDRPCFSAGGFMRPEIKTCI